MKEETHKLIVRNDLKQRHRKRPSPTTIFEYPKYPSKQMVGDFSFHDPEFTWCRYRSETKIQIQWTRKKNHHSNYGIKPKIILHHGIPKKKK